MMSHARQSVLYHAVTIRGGAVGGGGGGVGGGGGGVKEHCLFGGECMDMTQR